MSYGARFLGSVSVLTTILWFIFFITRNEASGASVYYSPKALGVSNYDQLNSLFKDYLKVLEKLKTGKPKHIRFGFEFILNIIPEIKGNSVSSYRISDPNPLVQFNIT